MAKHFGKPYVVKQITLKEALIGIITVKTKYYKYTQN